MSLALSIFLKKGKTIMRQVSVSVCIYRHVVYVYVYVDVRMFCTCMWRAEVSIEFVLYCFLYSDGVSYQTWSSEMQLRWPVSSRDLPVHPPCGREGRRCTLLCLSSWCVLVVYTWIPRKVLLSIVSFNHQFPHDYVRSSGQLLVIKMMHH